MPLRRSKRRASKVATDRINELFRSKRRKLNPSAAKPKTTSNEVINPSKRLTTKRFSKKVLAFRKQKIEKEESESDEDYDDRPPWEKYTCSISYPSPPPCGPNGFTLHSGNGMEMNDFDDEKEQKQMSFEHQNPWDKYPCSNKDPCDDLPFFNPSKFRHDTATYKGYEDMLSQPVLSSNQVKAADNSNPNIGRIIVIYKDDHSKHHAVNNGTALVFNNDKNILLTSAHLSEIHITKN